MNWKLQRAPLQLFLTLLIISSMLSACGNSLWGSYDPFLTQTADPLQSATLPPLKPTDTETPTLVPPTPTETFTLTSTQTTAPTDTPIPPGPTATAGQMTVYTSQSGDSLAVVANHFGVDVSEISSQSPLPSSGFIDPGTRLIIPNRLGQTAPSDQIMPDSEVVYSPSAIDFDIEAYVSKAGGKLSTYQEYLASSGWTSGAGDVQRIAFESTINPRLLLAIIQYLGGWVEGQPFSQATLEYPLAHEDPAFKGLYQQMRWAIAQISSGYYGWRAGRLTQLTFPNGMTMRIAPGQNAGTVAVQNFFSKLYDYPDWLNVISPGGSFMKLYDDMFGDPAARSEAVGPLFPPGLNQPQLTLPFEVNKVWSLTGGPHPAWEAESAWAALDFAPATNQSGCVESDAWVVAAAPGRVVRSSLGYVVLDLDGDGYEETGWDVLYLHIATKDRAPLGAWMNAGDRIGHPSCEGGEATGTHIHFARKYNGEWVAAGGPLPFALSGWTTHEGGAAYKGTLTKGDKVVTANQFSTRESVIIRSPGD